MKMSLDVLAGSSEMITKIGLQVWPFKNLLKKSSSSSAGK